jgi:hypothetical protein
MITSPVWVLCVQDKDASDPMDEAISLAGLSGLMKQAIKLIKGIEVKHEGDSFSFGLFSVISWFKVMIMWEVAAVWLFE